jgi:tetratricopeptide (TPR) repeat protein/transcriptional regulator with XRE-family HTH domain
VPVGEQPALSFAGLLHQLRVDAGLTQEKLAHAASLSPRSISDLERGVNRTARKDTARLLADAFGLIGPERELFEAAANGQATAVETLAASRRAGGAGVRTLPRDIASFTGRTGELRRLTAALGDAAGGGGVVSIHAIGGMAGVGKTALAVHAAHQLAADYPDGQYFLPLHGHTPGQKPVQPADALATLLLTVGLRASHIPADLEARTALWRDHVAGRKILLVLDDATGHEQVRPLLPGTAGGLVLITSRRLLAALEDAVPLSLDTLPPDEAAALLIWLSGRPDLGSDSASQLARLCGYLPLAIGLVGRQLSHHPAWTAADLAADLAAARDRLELMQAEDVSVAAAFDLSYRDLGAGQQRLFRRLGLHPGPDFDAHAAAALDATSLAEARRHLDDFYDQHLLSQPSRRRYRFHDLIREHARALAADEPADGAATTGRLLDYYLHTALAASRHVAVRLRGDRRPPPPARLPACAPRLSTAERAMAWLAAERGNLQAATEHAAACGYHQYATQIPAAISNFLDAGGYWDQAIGLHRTALAAARQAGDRRGQADALNRLAIFQTLTGNLAAGAANQRQALALYRELGDRLGQGDALHTEGFVREMMDDYLAAASSFRQALARYREAGDRIGQGDALVDLGDAQQLAGDYSAAGASMRQALTQYREAGDRYGQAVTLGGLGGLQIQTGEYPAAVTSLRQALELYRDLGDRDGEAHAVAALGIVQRLTGDYPAAMASLRHAHEIFGQVGDRANYAALLGEIGIVHRLTGDYAAAADCLGQALGLARDLGDRFNQADVGGQLGALHVQTGDYAAAADCLGSALEMCRAIGARLFEAAVLNTLGELRLRCAAGREAAEYHTAALGIARDFGAPVEEARAREGLGRCHIQAGAHPEGATQLREALAIYQRLGDPAAARVRQALHDPGAGAGSLAISRSTSSPG